MILQPYFYGDTSLLFFKHRYIEHLSCLSVAFLGGKCYSPTFREGVLLF